jgi:hypothetical protein
VPFCDVPVNRQYFFKELTGRVTCSQTCSLAYLARCSITKLWAVNTQWWWCVVLLVKKKKKKFVGCGKGGYSVEPLTTGNKDLSTSSELYGIWVPMDISSFLLPRITDVNLNPVQESTLKRRCECLWLKPKLISFSWL